MTPLQNTIAHLVQSAVIAGLVVYAVVTHKVDTATGVGIIAALSGTWVGAVAAVKVTGSSNATSPPAVSVTDTAAVAAPSSSLVPPAHLGSLRDPTAAS